MKQEYMKKSKRKKRLDLSLNNECYQWHSTEIMNVMRSLGYHFEWPPFSFYLVKQMLLVFHIKHCHSFDNVFGLDYAWGLVTVISHDTHWEVLSS